MIGQADHPSSPPPPSLAWDEGDRLAALAAYEVLDTAPEPEFDAIVKLACQICETPIGAISLVADGRQWFKAEVGLGIRETSLVVAVCDDVIRLAGTTAIHDLAQDPRFAGSPLVTGPPKLRFYAGAPLLTGGGLPLGMLCVLDTRPRHLSADQLAALDALAGQVMAQLELRRLLAERDAALAQRELLVRELHHRVKNTLATVQAVMNATARSAPSLQDFQSAFAGRIAAMAKTHALLTEDEWQSVSLRDLLCAELEPFTNGDSRRLMLEGPEVELPSELAIPIGMAVHELTSNAAKYGALADADGRVELRWQVTCADSHMRLKLDWNEHDGPPVALPTREGFGTRLLRRILTLQTGADVGIHYEPDGLHVHIDVPLPPAPA